MPHRHVAHVLVGHNRACMAPVDADVDVRECDGLIPANALHGVSGCVVLWHTRLTMLPGMTYGPPVQPSSTGVVITGLGGWTAFGAGWIRTWTALCRGESAIAPAGSDLPGAEMLSVALIRDLTPFRVAFPNIRPPLPLKHSRLALVAAQEALADAGFAMDHSTAEIGAMFDRGWNADAVAVQLLSRVLNDGAQATSPFLFSQSVANAPLGMLGQHLGLRGPHLMTLGGGALYLAVMALRNGEAQAIVAGGLDELETNRLIALHQCGLVDASAAPEKYLNDDAPRTLGEGAVALVLEREDAARARGARSYARVLAVACELCSYSSRGFDDRQTKEAAEVTESLLARAERDRAAVGLNVGGGGAHRLGSHLGESFGMRPAALVAFCAHALRSREVPAVTIRAGVGVLPVDRDLALVQDVGFDGQLFACLLERDAA